MQHERYNGRMGKHTQRIGIYAGTFNPVHAGHIAFALQAMQAAKLDKVYFLPERRPRYKQGVEHFAHRAAMLRRASQPHPHFEVIELEDVTFNVKRTLPKLEAMFPGSRLVFLFGSDVVEHMGDWEQIHRLFTTSELLVGIRAEADRKTLQDVTASWPVQPLVLQIISSHAADVSSRSIRQALRARTGAKGLLSSVVRYSNHHWLYVSLA